MIFSTYSFLKSCECSILLSQHEPENKVGDESGNENPRKREWNTIMLQLFLSKKKIMLQL
jgi:hypothetical protein